MRTWLVIFSSLLLSSAAAIAEAKCTTCGPLLEVRDELKRTSTEIKDLTETEEQRRTIGHATEVVGQALHQKKPAAEIWPLLAEVCARLTVLDRSARIADLYDDEIRAAKPELQKAFERLVKDKTISQREVDAFWFNVNLQQAPAVPAN